MTAKKDYHRNARFQLRLDQTTLDALRRKAARLDIPMNHLIATILERECDDMTNYHVQMTAKHSYATFAMLNVLATKMLPVEVRKEVMGAIQAQANRLFGSNPDIPEMILINREGNDPDYISDVFKLFEHYATNRWGIKPD